MRLQFSDEGRTFPGIVLDGALVADLSPSFDRRMDASTARLDELAGGHLKTLDLASLRVLAPFEPGQILQSGATYKRHVIELAVDQRIAP